MVGRLVTYSFTFPVFRLYSLIRLSHIYIDVAIFYMWSFTLCFDFF